MRPKKFIDMQRKTICSSAALLLLVVSSSSATAAIRSGWFMGAGIGASDYKGIDVDARLAQQNFTTKTELADEGVGWRLFVGYQTRYAVGFDVEYLNLKKRTGGTVFTVPLVDVAETESTTDGLALSGHIAWSVRNAPRTSISASAGTFLWHNQTSIISLAGGTSAVAQVDKYDFAQFYGAALERRITKRASLRFEWRSLKMQGSPTDSVSFSVIRLMGIK